MTRPQAPQVVEVDRETVAQVLERAKAALLSSDFALLEIGRAHV